MSGSGISWAICKSAPRSRQITTPAPHRSVFYRPDALPAAQPTASKHLKDKLAAYHVRSQVCVEPPLSAVSMMLFAFAAERRRLLHGARSAPAAVDRYIVPTGCSVANPPGAVVDRWTDRQTDRRADGRATDTRPLQRVRTRVLWATSK